MSGDYTKANIMTTRDAVLKFLNEEISEGKLAEVVTNKRDLIGAFSQVIDEIMKPVSEGRWLVSSEQCSEIEIADAQATGRFFVLFGGLGFVSRYPESLALLKKDRVKLRQMEADQ